MFLLFFILAITILFLPLLPGLLGLLFSAIGYSANMQQFQFSLNGFIELFNWPGIIESIAITLIVTVSSTLLTMFISFSVLQTSWHRPSWHKIEKLLAPIMALPHVAFAVGFAFLFSNSGFIARIFDWASLPNSLSNLDIVNNQYGLGLIVALTIKEIPFILFMSIPLLKQLNISQSLRLGQSLGYTSAQVWQKIIFPQWLPKIRFSLLAIMAYSLSVVDVSLVIGPTNPPTLPVLLWSWISDADLQRLPMASAAATLLTIICLAFVLMMRVVEWLVIEKRKCWQYSGRFSLPTGGFAAIYLTYLISLSTLLILLIWSFAKRWSFPNIIPSKWSTVFWHQEWQYLLDVSMTSTVIAISSATIALLLVIILHEHNAKFKSKNPNFTIPYLMIAIPMLVPQLSLLFGMQLATLYIAPQYYYFWVIWSHVFFAFPYLYLALDGPWRSYDKRLDKIGLSLGLSPLKVWWKIKRPILLPAICIAWAIAISVSLAQYLPTLMLGAGRITTLTTEAVALSSGQDRRITALYALLQSLLPFIFFLFAIIVGHKTGKIETQTRHIKYDTSTT